MHYKWLSEVGEHYADETTTPIMETMRSGATVTLRTLVLRGIATKMLKAKIHCETLLADATTSPQALDLAHAEYQRERRHFQNQGGVIGNDGKLDAAASGADGVVLYDRNADQPGLTRLHVVGGRLCRDAAGTQPFDTSAMSTVQSGLGYASYVMSEEGNIHSDSHIISSRHHSSLLGGRQVAGAGEMKVEAGVIKYLSNKSGHHRPNVLHLVQTLHQLQKLQANLNAARIVVLPSGDEHATVAGFLASLAPEQDYHHAKLIAYVNSYPYAEIAQHLDAVGWRFPTHDEYYRLNMKGVIDKATGRAVDHKLVCQRLKGMGLRCDPQASLALAKQERQQLKAAGLRKTDPNWNPNRKELLQRGKGR